MKIILLLIITLFVSSSSSVALVLVVLVVDLDVVVLDFILLGCTSRTIFMEMRYLPGQTLNEPREE